MTAAKAGGNPPSVLAEGAMLFRPTSPGISLLPLNSRSPEPFISSLTHRLFFAIFKPSHKGPVELKAVAAFGFEETPHILSIAIGLRNRCRSRYFAAMPIKRYHTAPPTAPKQ
jgi:hypothetical protein